MELFSLDRTAVQKIFYGIGKVYGRTINPFVDFVNVLLTGNQLADINALFEVPEDEGPEGPDLAHP
jgi:hypothetical protein